MHRLTCITLLAIAMIQSPACAQDAAAEAAIRAIIAQQVVAWDAGDGTRYASHMAPDASFTNLFGMVMYGAPSFAKRHNEILSTFYKNTSSDRRHR